MSQLEEYEKSDNIAEMLSEDQLRDIAMKVSNGYKIDLDSRREWEETLEDALKLANQVYEPKSKRNLERSASVKLPLLTKGVIDFASRVYPEFVQGDKVVHAKVIGSDPQGRKDARGLRVSKFMSHKLLDIKGDWEENQDKLLHSLPIYGTVFKKLYYDHLNREVISETIDPIDVIINNNIVNLERAQRVTHRISMTSNEIKEMQNFGFFSDIELEKVPYPITLADGTQEQRPDDPDKVYSLLEQHCYLDLDEDGYKEPYIVILVEGCNEILRIHHRFKKIERKGDKLIRIIPENYFIDYHYIRNPGGGYYSLGLGKLLTPLNEAANAVMDQLIDAGTLANSQSGFIGAGARIKEKNIDLEANTFKVLNNTMGGDLRANVLPLPAPQPSPVLFNLLGLLIEAGKDVASVNDALEGKQPAQNVPATTILTLVEQGLKVYNAIVKRLYRAMRKEFCRIYDLYGENLTQKEYEEVLDDIEALVSVDFSKKGFDIVPIADPGVSSDAQRLAKARSVMELGVGDPWEKGVFYLKALQFEEPEIMRLLGPRPDPNAPPPPDAQKMLAEAEKAKAETQEILNNIQTSIMSLQIQDRDSLARTQEAQMRSQKMLADIEVNRAKTEIASDSNSVETELKVRKQIDDEINADRAAEQKDNEMLLKAAELRQKREAENKKQAKDK